MEDGGERWKGSEVNWLAFEKRHPVSLGLNVGTVES